MSGTENWTLPTEGSVTVAYKLVVVVEGIEYWIPINSSNNLYLTLLGV